MRLQSLPHTILLPLLGSLVAVNGQGNQPPTSTTSEQGGSGGGGGSSGGGDGGNSTFLTDLQQALQQSGFTQFANLTNSLNSTEQGQALLTRLSDGSQNYTLFVPSDEALSNVSSDVRNNETHLAEIVSYHVVHGGFFNESASSGDGGGGGGMSSSSSMESMSSSSESLSTSQVVVSPSPTATGSTQQANSGGGNSSMLQAATWPNVTIGRTFLNASDLVQLEGNKSQVLAWTKFPEQQAVTILNQISNTSQNMSTVNSTQWRNLFVNGIDGVLIPPGNITTALNAVNDTPALNILETTQVTGPNGTNISAIEFGQSAQGITIFAPDSEAFTSEVNSSLSELAQSDPESLKALLKNHYINGTTIYSTGLAELISSGASNSTSGGGSSNSSSSQTQSSLINAAGEPLQFTQNSTGTFIMGGNGTSAQIVRPDVLIKNGVIHIVDRLLYVTDSDDQAASAAYESATSAAGISTTETGTVFGGIPVQTGGGGSESSSSSSSEMSSSTESTSSQPQSTATETTTSELQSTVTGGGGGGGETTTTATQPQQSAIAFGAKFAAAATNDAGVERGLFVAPAACALVLGAFFA